MHEPVQLAGLVLAAGDSTRMGADKAMLPWPPPAAGATDSPRHTLLSAALLAFDHFTRFNVVVAGRNADAIATRLVHAALISSVIQLLKTASSVRCRSVCAICSTAAATRP